jgi:hypothetical protein
VSTDVFSVEFPARPLRAAVRLSDVVAVGLTVLVAAGLARVLFTLDLEFPFSNEGWTAYHAAAAVSGAPLYPPSGAPVYNNYPPLGFYPIGGLGRLIGDTVLAGRILSVAAFLAIALGVMLASRRLGCNFRAAGFAALVFAATMLFDFDYVGVGDPQMIAHAVQIFALVLCLREPRTTASLALAAFLFATALFVKHALIVQPLVVGVWLLAYDRRSGLKLAAFGIAFLLAGAGLFQWIYGHPLLEELHDARVYRLAFALHAIAGRFVIVLPLAVSALLLRRYGRDRHYVLCVAYLVAALATATFFLGGAGTGGKMLFDTVIALSLCAGVGVHRVADGRSRLPQWLVVAAQVVPLAAYVVFRSLAGNLPHHWLATDNPAVTDTARGVAWLKSVKGEVLCNEPVLCFRAGKPFAVDLWGYEEAVAVGARDGRELIDAIAHRRYAVLQLAAPPDALGAMPEADPVWSRKVSDAIVANYRVAYASFNGTFWVPK